MFRASRPLVRLVPRPPCFIPARSLPLLKTNPATVSRPGVSWPLLPRARLASGDVNPPPPRQPINRERERQIAQQVLQPNPDGVSTQSSVRRVIEGSGSPPQDDVVLAQGVKHDIDIFRSTFSMSKVPRESLILGLGGTVPYLLTSLSTIFLAWDLNHQVPTGNAILDFLFIDHATAQHLLGIIEPIQLGYGAVIISFLGAIHWGLEYAEKTPSPRRTRFRYGVGVAASTVAWPTLFMPFEYALTAQFMSFLALYFVDSRSAARGLAPSWYGIYRFPLTAMVGLALLLSLVGRAKISAHGRLSSQGLSASMSSPGLADHSTNWAKLEAEEIARNKKAEAEKKKAEAEKEKAEAKEAKEPKGRDGKQDKDQGESENKN